ncbi:MAG: transglycosylase SLT domain-containing protein [Nocardioides sp.]
MTPVTPAPGREGRDRDNHLVGCPPRRAAPPLVHDRNHHGWQESGWEQHRISSAGALGAMQIMPETGRWMSQVLGRRLNPRDLYHNASAGVGLIRLLRTEARPRIAIAGYYQGLAGVRRDGMHPSTRAYVADVLALRKRISGGWRPR